MTVTTDPAKIASITARAVDQIGDGAAEEIERVADAMEDEAKQKADNLRRFAAAFREQTRLAAEDINAFCAKTTDIFTSIENLRSRVARDIPLDDLKRLSDIGQNSNGVAPDADSN